MAKPKPRKRNNKITCHCEEVQADVAIQSISCNVKQKAGIVGETSVCRKHIVTCLQKSYQAFEVFINRLCLESEQWGSRVLIVYVKSFMH